MRQHLIKPLAAVCAVAMLPMLGCRRQKGEPEKSEKVTEGAAPAAQAGGEQATQPRTRDDVVQDAEKQLSDIDQKIQELRAQVQQKAEQMSGQARADMNQALSDLETARNRTRTAVDQLKQATQQQEAQMRQDVTGALDKLHQAYGAAVKHLTGQEAHGAPAQPQPTQGTQKQPPPGGQDQGTAP